MGTSTERYRAFIKVAELKSFSEAAHDLGFSPSAMSRMITALEKEWGIVLFERSKAGVCLTADGEQLLPYARRLTASEATFAEAVSAITGGESGHVRIGTFSSVATHWLPKVIGSFLELHPKITYELLLGDYGEIEKWVQEGRVDCGFTRLFVSPSSNAVKIADDELKVLLPRNHALCQLSSVPSEALLEERFFLLQKDGNTVVDEAFEQCGGTPRSPFVTWDDYAIMAMVEAGLGVSILPNLILQRISYDIEIRPFANPVYRQIGLITRKVPRTSAAARHFIDFALQSLKSSSV